MFEMALSEPCIMKIVRLVDISELDLKWRRLFYEGCFRNCLFAIVWFFKAQRAMDFNLKINHLSREPLRLVPSLSYR